jgi:hypothetical protein
MKNRLKNKFISNYTIYPFYGGLGNNLQQIALGIMHSNLKGCNFYVEENKYIKSISKVNNRFSNNFKKFKHLSRFYYFDNISEKFAQVSYTDYPLDIHDKEFYLDNFNDIFINEIYPNLKFLKQVDIDENTIVIHVRSGDVFDDGHSYYLQNPLNYYLDLISRYDKAIIVSSQPFNNPVIAYLSDNPKVEIQSSTAEEDFNILCNAKNLATSGVGTFAIAAAMCSKKIENLYYSDLFFNHHLNPTMIKKVNHIKYKFENYLKVGDIWNGSSQQISKMLSDKIKILEI